ncbi:MAG TPA: hypothetical protein VGN63_22425 [Flavisolibacter sp.]|jgi:hypothetical protein|nr:hypothetical protein [Flavisolibacter sp.]
MKQLTVLFFLAILISCSNNAGDTAATKDSSEASSDTWRENELGEAPADKEQFFIWQVDTDNKTLTKNPQLHPSYYSVDTLIMGLNERYPQIQLERKHLGHDTLYTEVKNATYLTNQMGSAGSEQYIAQVVLNLTAVKGINHVRIDFEEGSHASPDVWSRKSFAGYKEVQ